MSDQTISAQQVSELQQKLSLVQDEVGKVIVGQQDVVQQVLMGMLAGGHCLLEGVPGLAKTLMVSSLAQTLDLDFTRVQFTPDLMPSDIIGTEILETDHDSGKRFFKFQQGPVFTNLLLADEINRTPPKTQAALLEAMQEKKVSYAGHSYALPKPFFVLATQNPVEQSGTYPLPEAQLDRFLLFIRVGYPSAEEEIEILRRTTSNVSTHINAVLQAQDIIALQSLVREVEMAEPLLDYVSRVVRATRPETSDVAAITQFVRWGAGPRAGQALTLCAKARAFLQGRFAVTVDDIKAVAHSVLRHRILLNFQAEADNMQSDQVIDALLQALSLPVSPLV
ncbi:MAG: MoxR family ATPase [Paraglaciecola sp.]|uniref:AAA family ATPase n=1 Tax=Paraglaciecola sp. TaxID=1920173 RepID=UPI0027683BEE|nr:MoxR family ATPase [Paraglaciecola sp.]MDP5129333.1 MoxR family ATPase [Paraglaciecola sp.]